MSRNKYLDPYLWEYALGAGVERGPWYLGAGLSYVKAEVTDGVSADEDGSPGGWVGFGWRKWDRFYDDEEGNHAGILCGILVRHVFATDLTLFGQDTNADGLQVMVAIPTRVLELVLHLLAM